MSKNMGRTYKVHRTCYAWGVLWRSENHLDGRTESLICDGTGRILTLPTRAQAREYIKKHYGYIKQRPDLRAEPHGWKMPMVVRVKVEISAMQKYTR